MKKRVLIIGYGVVGLAMQTVLMRAHDIFIHDPAKGHSIWQGLEQRFDLAVICVPTPPKPDGAADLKHIHEAAALCDSIPLVVIKSAVPPGTTDALNLKYNTSKFHASPEYIGELKNYVDPSNYLSPTDGASHPFCIVGGPRADKVLEFFSRCMAVSAKYIPCTAVEAELCKYMENSYLATKVTFCNEWARIAAAFGVDYMQLRHLWLHDPRVDPSHTLVFKDEPGFGGKCLPKDLAAIIHASISHGYSAPFLSCVEAVNINHREKK